MTPLKNTISGPQVVKFINMVDTPQKKNKNKQGLRSDQARHWEDSGQGRGSVFYESNTFSELEKITLTATLIEDNLFCF